MILSTVVVLLVGFLVYASTATLENTVHVTLKLKNYELPEKYGGGVHTMVHGKLPLSYDDIFEPGMKVRIGKEEGTISSAFELGDGMINVVCEMESYYIPLPEGDYEGVVVVGSSTPISFLWQ